MPTLREINQYLSNTLRKVLGLRKGEAILLYHDDVRWVADGKNPPSNILDGCMLEQKTFTFAMTFLHNMILWNAYHMKPGDTHKPREVIANLFDLALIRMEAHDDMPTKQIQMWRDVLKAM